MVTARSSTINDHEMERVWFRNPSRRLFVRPTFEGMSEQAAEITVQALRGILAKQDHAVLVPSSGKSPKLLYKILAENHKNDVDWHRVIVVQMDEYWGIRPEDPQSMWYSIEHGLVSPLGITQFLKYFDGRGALIRPITEYEQTINTLGGIDLIIHGMGRNGHIGFCEPGMPWDAPTQKVRLADSTLAANFGDDSALRENYHDGVTLGLAVLTAARHALLLLTGDAKDDAARAFFHKPPSVAIPASSVVRNPSVDCVVDASTISLG